MSFSGVFLIMKLFQAPADWDEQQSSPAEAVVPAAAEDQRSTPVAKPDHAASSATPKSAQHPNTSSYAPVAPAPFEQKLGGRPKVSYREERKAKPLTGGSGMERPHAPYPPPRLRHCKKV